MRVETRILAGSNFSAKMIQKRGGGFKEKDSGFSQAASQGFKHFGDFSQDPGKGVQA